MNRLILRIRWFVAAGVSLLGVLAYAQDPDSSELELFRLDELVQTDNRLKGLGVDAGEIELFRLDDLVKSDTQIRDLVQARELEPAELEFFKLDDVIRSDNRYKAFHPSTRG